MEIVVFLTVIQNILTNGHMLLAKTFSLSKIYFSYGDISAFGNFRLNTGTRYEK